jgi:uncharacterized membrane protein YhaH (DUF805 family)
MQIFRLLLSPSGRLGAKAYVLAALGVYAAGVVSQWLTTPKVMARGGVWPFAFAQVLLIWIWFAIHSKRLRDADRSVAPAATAAVLYSLLMLLLLFVLEDPLNHTVRDPSSVIAITLILFIWVVVVMTSPSTNHYLISMLVFLLACLPIIFVIAFTLWAATRPSIKEQTT